MKGLNPEGRLLDIGKAHVESCQTGRFNVENALLADSHCTLKLFQY
jgi:UDP-N-acetylmuramyl tripeptide synthase